MGYSKITETFSKNWVRCCFILPTGQLIFKTCKYDDNKVIKVGKCSYVFEPKLIHYEKHIPYLTYFADNPNPITFVYSKNVFQGRVITSETFNEVLESKVIKEMVSLGAAEPLIIILLGIVIILGILNLAASAGFLTPQAVNATMNATINATNASGVIIH